jgi:acyl transferase domain-containing protein
VKTNIGHTAAAAGIAGVIKVLLALRHRPIPASLNFDEPNRHIDFAESPFYVPTTLREWAVPEGGRRRAAVSAFGFSGTNAHVVIEEAPPRPARASTAGGRYLVPLSAHTDTALHAGMRRLADWIADECTASLPEIAYNLQFHRDHFAQRAVFVASDLAELESLLRVGEPGASGGIHEAERFLAGEQIDWAALWPGERHDRTPLPTYAFDRARHWFTENDTVYSADTGQGAPPRPQPDDDIRSLLHRLRAGEISEQEAEATMEVILGE